MLAQTLDLCLEVEGEIRPWQVDLAAHLPEEFEPVLGPGLRKLVAHELIEFRHDQPVEDVSLLVKAVEGLVRRLVVAFAGVGDRLVELGALEGLIAVPKLPYESARALPAEADRVDKTFKVSPPLLPADDHGLRARLG